jgi:hypothetical protein
MDSRWANPTKGRAGWSPATAARRLLVDQVRDLATGVGLAIRTARALHLPVEPGVAAGRDALILWAHLLDDVVPNA